MFFRKNLPGWERAARFAAAAAIAVCGFYWFGFSIAGYLVAAAGIFTGLTAIFGFCPACAMIGRKPISPN